MQTLFYGVFSAWVLWARQTPAPTGGFDWRTAVRHLRAPVLAAFRGRELAALLDPETPVPLSPDLKAIAVPETTAGRNMTGDAFALTAGWGRLGAGGAVMPGQGRVTERGSVFDVYLNDAAFWRDVPAAVWSYRLGGYQVLKKWLSYRERPILGRDMTPEEVRHFTDMARRIAAILFIVFGLDRYESPIV